MHLLGYAIDTEAPDPATGKEPKHFGPMPYELYISNVCRAFNCTPDVAERQDPILVQRIFTARNAEAALDLMNNQPEVFAKNPDLGIVLKLLTDAMNGDLEHD